MLPKIPKLNLIQKLKTHTNNTKEMINDKLTQYSSDAKLSCFASLFATVPTIWKRVASEDSSSSSPSLSDSPTTHEDKN